MFKRAQKIWPTLILVFLTSTVSCSSDVPQEGVRYINAEKAGQVVRQQSDVVVLDIRTPKEFAEGHIAGAVNIDYYSDTFKQSLSELDKEKTYLVHCRSGGRSGRSMKLFRELGFESVIHLDGGIKAWASEKLPLKK